tara:strand:- start:287 stop:898 length:612 start_codon:yes stop_codon:yes gene_type:complete
MIGLIDYGMGNILSVYNALLFVGADVEICSSTDQINKMDKLILPGVGAFSDCMKNLNSKNFIDSLNFKVIKEEVPILGICLGMQVMASSSQEGGTHKGLNWFDAEVVPIHNNQKEMKILHVGWNSLNIQKENKILKNIPADADFYFIQAYHMKCNNSQELIATSEYYNKITSVINKKNIFGTQFHPEKSQDHGMTILENFMDL